MGSCEFMMHEFFSEKYEKFFHISFIFFFTIVFCTYQKSIFIIIRFHFSYYVDCVNIITLYSSEISE